MMQFNEETCILRAQYPDTASAVHAGGCHASSTDDFAIAMTAGHPNFFVASNARCYEINTVFTASSEQKEKHAPPYRSRQLVTECQRTSPESKWHIGMEYQNVGIGRTTSAKQTGLGCT